MYIKYCVFSKILEYIPDFGLSLFPLGVRACTQCVHNGSAAADHVELRKITSKNTIFNEHPVYN